MPEVETTPATNPGETPGGQTNPTTPPTPVVEKAPETWEDGSPFDAERAKATIAHLRQIERESTETKRERDTLAEAVRAHEREKLSETERLQAELSDAKAENVKLKQQIQDITERRDLGLIARELGFADEEDAILLADRSKLTRGDDGHFTNAKKVLEDLLAAKPHLRGQTEEGQRRNGPPSTPPRQADPTLEQIMQKNRGDNALTGRYGAL